LENIIFDLDGTLWDPYANEYQGMPYALNGFDCMLKPYLQGRYTGGIWNAGTIVGKKLVPYLTEEQQI